MKSILMIICLFVFLIKSNAQTYNLIPCPDFECAEYILPPGHTFCQNNNSCCDSKLYVLDEYSNIYAPHELNKYEEFACGPWYEDTRGQEFYSVNYVPTLCSNSINLIYPLTNIENDNAYPWNNDNTQLCLTELDDCSGNRSLCPSEFGAPNSTFGYQEFTITNGLINNNYIGLRSSDSRRDGIKVKLIQPLIPCKTYIFECDAARKTDNETQLKFRLTSDGSWGDDEGGDEAISIGNDANNANDWVHIYHEFQVEDISNWFHLRIKTPNGFFGFRTLLIDNVQIYDKCEKDIIENTCIAINPNYDIISVNEVHSNQIPFTIFNCSNFSILTFRIETLSGAEILTKTIVNPPNEVSWDGKNQMGDFVSDGPYYYKIYSSHNCNPAYFCLKENSFSKIGDYSCNLLPVVNVGEGDIVVTNLQNATYFKLEIKNNSTLIRIIEINNPQNTIAWDGLNNLGFSTQDGIYSYFLTVSNSCESVKLNGDFNKSNIPTSAPYFDYTSLPKEITTGNCGYLLNPQISYYKPPTPCCTSQPDIHIENVILDGDLLIAAIGVISIGNNVNITPGSTITIKAGADVVGANNLNFNSNLGASVNISIEPCVFRLSSSIDNVILEEHVNYKRELDIKGSFNIIPNPNSGRFWLDFSQLDEILGFDIKTLDGICIYNRKGYFSSKKFELELNNLNSGMYIISVKTRSGIYTKKFITI